ncbi:MAG TPA: acyl carrier protein [Acidimicrobiales bacterium]|nr:acyl carrier protein [Acidimicrobiales bacterium]
MTICKEVGPAENPRSAVPSDALTFELYVRCIVTGLEIDARPDLSPALPLESLGLDSLGVFELIVLSEQLAGASAPPDQNLDVLTLGDAYVYYRESIDTS